MCHGWCVPFFPSFDGVSLLRPKKLLKSLWCSAKGCFVAGLAPPVPYTRVLAFADVHLIIICPRPKEQLYVEGGAVRDHYSKGELLDPAQFLGWISLSVGCSWIMDGAPCVLPACLRACSSSLLLSHPIEHETVARFTEKRWTRAIHVLAGLASVNQRPFRGQPQVIVCWSVKL